MTARFTRHPKQLVWRGVVQAGALWFEAELIPEPEARRRILALWSPGDRVERHEAGLLLRFATPRRMVCAQTPGAPLVKVAGRLVSAPLPEAAVRGLHTPEAAIILVQAEAAQIMPRGTEEDLSSWLNVGEWNTGSLKPLGKVPPPPDLLPAVQTDSRAALGLAPADAELAEVLQALQHPQESTPLWRLGLDSLGALLRRLFHFRLPWPIRRQGRQEEKPLQTIQPELKVLDHPLFLMMSFGIILLLASRFIVGVSSWDAKFLLVSLAVILAGVALFYLIQQIGLFSWISNLLQALNLGWLFRRPSPSPKPPRKTVVVPTPGWLTKLLNGLVFAFVAGIFVSLLFANGSPLRNLWSGFISSLVLLLGLLFLCMLIGAGQMIGAGIIKLVTSIAGAFSQTASATPQPSRPPAQPNFFGQRLMSFFGRAILLSKLGGVIGRRQAAYIGRMMEMFERGDFENALRHAIPLGDAMDSSALTPALGVPRPLDKININPYGATGGKAIMLSGLEEHLRPLYRRAFERLKEQGRFKEAAYVLAELLRANQEAVSFLEQHDELRLAAEVAEARKLPPDLVVRQWFIAGDRGRAVRYARLHSAFAGAITRLEKEERATDAEALRLLWADSLARAGDFENAVEQVWKLESGHALMQEWLRLGVELGGASGARLLARQLQLPEVDWEMARTQLQVLLAAEGVEAARFRAEFARKLPLVKNARTQVAARHTARVVWRDLQAGHIAPSTAGLSGLVRIAADGALRADLPSVPAQPHEPTSHFGVLQVEQTDRGAVPVYDTALLPDGSCLVALGETGVRWLGRDGHTKAHFDQPAFQLAPSVHGNMIVLLAPRGEATRMARLDLTTRRCTFWHEAILETTAPSHDGSIWFVAMNGRIMAIDLTAPGFGKMWDSGPLPGHCGLLQWNSKCLSALVSVTIQQDSAAAPPEPRLQLWTFSLPDLYLRGRPGLPVEYGANSVLVNFGLPQDMEPQNDAKRLPLVLMRTGQHASDALPTLELISQDKTIPLGLDITGGETTRPVSLREWLTVSTRQQDFCTCHVFLSGNAQLLGRVVLQGATSVGLRISGNSLVLNDDCGRVLVHDLRSGQLVKNWRIQ